MTRYGYAGEILEIDLSSNRAIKVSSEDYVDRFIGGRGLAARLYWERVPTSAKHDDPNNCLICASGPVAGFAGFAGSRWLACGKTFIGEPDTYSYANLGGKWGTALKYSGYDGLIVKGIADKPVYLYVDNETIDIRDASPLWGRSSFEACGILKADLNKDVSVLTIGQAGENRIHFATIVTDDGSTGSGGLGAVMGEKKLKAVVVRGKQRPGAADPEALKDLVPLMKQRRADISGFFPWRPSEGAKQQICYGCGLGCDRFQYSLADGRTFKSLCQATKFYQDMEMKYYGGKNDVHQHATRLCDGYGLDTALIQPIVEFLDACYSKGILKEEDTGLPISKIGSREFIEKLLQKITFKEGFGDVLSEGTIRAAHSIGKGAEDIVSDFVATRASETKDYDPRMTNTTALFYAIEPRRPIQLLHEVSRIQKLWINWATGGNGIQCSSEQMRRIAEAFWGGQIAADFSTLEGKPLAAKMIQDRAYVKESLVLCDRTWASFSGCKAIDHTMESRIYSAITGKSLDDTELNRIGERIFNLQRAILLREGWGGRKGDVLLDYYHEQPLKKGEIFFNAHALVPGKDGEVISRIGAILEREDFERMKSEYYDLREWDVETGFPTVDKLKELMLHDVAADLYNRQLLR